LNKISKQIKEGTYKWKDIKQIMIPKPGKKKEKTAWNSNLYG
jgi:retron-type reverse transcriptase